MELKIYITLLKKYSPFLVLCIILGSAVAVFSTNFMPSGYSLSQTFYLASPQSSAQSYNFEGFYAQEKARNFTDTAVAILESADFQSEVVGMGQTISVKKLAPQVIRVSTVAQNSESSQELMIKTIDTFNRKFIELAASDNALNLKQISKPSEPAFKTSSRKVYAAAGATLGLAFALVVISLKSYLKL